MLQNLKKKDLWTSRIQLNNNSVLLMEEIGVPGVIH